MNLTNLKKSDNDEDKTMKNLFSEFKNLLKNISKTNNKIKRLEIQNIITKKRLKKNKILYKVKKNSCERISKNNFRHRKQNSEFRKQNLNTNTNYLEKMKKNSKINFKNLNEDSKMKKRSIVVFLKGIKTEKKKIEEIKKKIKIEKNLNKKLKKDEKIKKALQNKLNHKIEENKILEFFLGKFLKLGCEKKMKKKLLSKKGDQILKKYMKNLPKKKERFFFDLERVKLKNDLDIILQQQNSFIKSFK